MPTSLDTHAAIKLTSLAAKARAITTELAANPAFPQKEEPSTLGKIAKGAAIGTAGLGTAYGVGSILRGRAWQQKVLGAPINTGAGLLGALKTGHGANMKDITGFRNRIGQRMANIMAPRALQANRGTVELMSRAAEERAREKGQVPGGNALRGAGMAYATGGAAPLIAGYQTGKDFEKSGIVYRKRDAALAGLAGLGGGAAGAGLGLLAGKGFGRNPDIALPTGMLTGLLAGSYGASRLVGRQQLKNAERDRDARKK